MTWGERAIRIGADGAAEACAPGDAGVLVHDPAHEEPSLAFALSRITWDSTGTVPLGVFRQVERPTYDESVAAQIAEARAERGDGELEALLHAGDTWTLT